MDNKPEFDKYAANYSGGNEDPLKRFFGNELDHFIRVKALWVQRYLRNISAGNACCLLDFGCGTGEMLKWLCRLGFQGVLHGADISSSMLEEAKKRWNEEDSPIFTLVKESGTPYGDETFDLIVATCVFHHVPPPERNDVLRGLKRVLKPDGRLVIFEHNPFNPLTRLIVKRAVIDRHAVLLFPNEILTRFENVKLRNGGVQFLMFYPPNFTILDGLDRFLWWCPMGAQYVAVGRK